MSSACECIWRRHVRAIRAPIDERNAIRSELLGNLADQHREIVVFKPYDPDGYTANAPFVMNAMPWKGKVLFSDFNRGLWAAKLEPKPPLVP